MKWQGRRQSSNVEDRRGMGGGAKTVIGGGIVGIVIYLITLLGGGDVQELAPILDQLNQTENKNEVTRELSPEEKELGAFVSTVFADTEDVWAKIFAENGLKYKEPGMVMFTGQVSTACGNATSAVGPFYCPSDQKVYMDLDFFQELKNKYGAKGGDFAIAYVIAHEVGHHVQTLLGTSSKVRKLQRGTTQVEANRLSVKQELQADFYAGVWAHYVQNYLDGGDIDEALSAANAVGDDAIQKRVQGHVVPDAFTHGTSKERKSWFIKGFETGDIEQGNTFAGVKSF